jgi:integrase
MKRSETNKIPFHKIDKVLREFPKTNKGTEMKIVSLFQYLTGLRIGEILSLTQKQIDRLLSTNQLSVILSKNKSRNIRTIKFNKNDKYFLILKSLLKDTEMFSSPKDKTRYKNGQYKFIVNFTSYFNKLLKKVFGIREIEFINNANELDYKSVNKFSSHSLRVGYIVRRFKATKDLTVVSKEIKHSSYQMTFYYLNVVDMVA